MSAKNNYIQSPLNYTGGKFRLLSQLLPCFPKNIRVFVDLFCGGGNVGINVAAQKVIYNDLHTKVVNLLNLFREIPESALLKEIYAIIRKYGLSLVKDNGYDAYNCSSSAGLAAYNKNGFLKLREAYNSIALKEQGAWRHVAMLYVLVAYAFNNQLRFNSLGKFNLPVGKRDFNSRMEEKLKNFSRRIKNQHCEFSNCDFRNFNVDNFCLNDLLYIDPPYLITCATYNENGGWNARDESELLDFLDYIDSRGIRFALSNILQGKGNENSILKSWLQAGKYNVHHFNCNYSNSNYQRVEKASHTDEILVTNYEPGI